MSVLKARRAVLTLVVGIRPAHPLTVRPAPDDARKLRYPSPPPADDKTASGWPYEISQTLMTVGELVVEFGALLGEHIPIPGVGVTHPPVDLDYAVMLEKAADALDRIARDKSTQSKGDGMPTGVASRANRLIDLPPGPICGDERDGNTRSSTAERISRWQTELRNRKRSESTIQGHTAHLMAAMRWAADMGLIVAAPKVKRPKRAKRSGGASPMKGRPITTEEFERMLDKVEAVLFPPPGEQEDETTEPKERKPPKPAKPLTAEQREQRAGVNGRISKIGRKARVVVHTHATTGAVKYASAHDLRRSFGERWSTRVNTATLMELMRHESIQTTMRFYVGRNAERTADAVWAAYKQQAGLGTKTGTINENAPGKHPEGVDATACTERGF